MIEQQHGLAYDAAKQSNGSVDTLAASLEIAETAELKSSELRIYKCILLASDREIPKREIRTIGRK